MREYSGVPNRSAGPNISVGRHIGRYHYKCRSEYKCRVTHNNQSLICNYILTVSAYSGGVKITVVLKA